MTSTVDLRLDGSVDRLRIAWMTAETLLSEVPFVGDAQESRYQVLLCLTELLTNVLRHGYAGEGPVELRFEASEQEFAFEIRDWATPFDPTTAEPATRPLAEGELSEGGYGLMIVRSVMDGFEYRLEGRANVIRATKKVESRAAVSAEE